MRTVEANRFVFPRFRRCIPDGGDVGYTMTELQPSPPGYRVQDEAPGPPSCPPGPYKYASHGHAGELTNFKSAPSYTPEGYGLKQSPSRTVPANEYYRRRNDGRRSAENEHEAGSATKEPTVASYNESHKKNTAGYKNDSGYAASDGILFASLFPLTLDQLAIRRVPGCETNVHTLLSLFFSWRYLYLPCNSVYSVSRYKLLPRSRCSDDVAKDVLLRLEVPIGDSAGGRNLFTVNISKTGQTH